MNESERAVMESARFAAMESYFEARPQIATTRKLECIFEAGFDAAYAEIRRLREENERIHAATPQQSPGPDCRTCANRGRVNGLSQETYCDGCVWYAHWKKNHYNPIQEPAP